MVESSLDVLEKFGKKLREYRTVIDEVRELGKEAGLPESYVENQLRVYLSELERLSICGEKFFTRDSKTVAKDLVGRTLVRRIDDELYKLQIVETGAYHGHTKKRREGLEYAPGLIHVFVGRRGYKTLTISTDREGVASVVTIRRARDKEGRLYSSNKLTEELSIGKEFDGIPITGKGLWIEGYRAEDSLIEYISPTEAKMSKNCLGYYRLKL